MLSSADNKNKNVPFRFESLIKHRSVFNTIISLLTNTQDSFNYNSTDVPEINIHNNNNMQLLIFV